MSELFDKNRIKENKLKSVEITCVDLKKPGNELSEYYEEFDEKGNTCLTLFYDSNGTLMRRTSFHYDRNGKLIKKIYFDINQMETIREDYIYNESNHLIEIKNISGDAITHNLYTYDNSGNLREHMKCDASGGLHELCKYLFDSSGNSAGKVVYDGFGKILSRTIHNCDPYGCRKKSITYRGKGDLHIVEHYDNKGRVTEMIDYGTGVEHTSVSPDMPEELKPEEEGPQSPVFRMEVTDQGNIIGTEAMGEEESPAPEGNFITRHVYEYDNYDQCTQEIVYDSRGSMLYKIKQNYDHNRNKIQYKIEDSPMNWLTVETKYNDKGLIEEERIYSSDGEPGKLRKFNYTFYY